MFLPNDIISYHHHQPPITSTSPFYFLTFIQSFLRSLLLLFFFPFSPPLESEKKIELGRRYKREKIKLNSRKKKNFSLTKWQSVRGERNVSEKGIWIGKIPTTWHKRGAHFAQEREKRLKAFYKRKTFSPRQKRDSLSSYKKNRTEKIRLSQQYSATDSKFAPTVKSARFCHYGLELTNS